MKQDFLSVLDLKDDFMAVLELARGLKTRFKMGEKWAPLEGKSIAMIFEKPSTRTRVSLESGIAQLGGNCFFLGRSDLQLVRGETIADTARVLSRYVDAIIYRTFSHNNMSELAQYATVPVINALDDLEHPCQAMTDLYTLMELKPNFPRLKLAYVGDGNNVCNSLLLACAICGVDMTAACPVGYEPNDRILKRAQEIASESGSRLEMTRDPLMSVKDADAVYTDVWVSMGDEDEAKERQEVFRPYQVNSTLLSHAKEDHIVLHCLPAHRGEEITDDVIEGPSSRIFDQAENRLHVQKAILSKIIE